MKAKLLPVSLLLFILFGGTTLLKAQTDSIVFTNGNYMVGEIKKMGMGVMQIETDYSDSDFTIDWELIKYIKSDQIYLIQTSTGDRYNGPFSTTPGNSANIDIVDKDEGTVSVPLVNVVNLKTVDQSFVSRLDLSLSLGYNLTKANSNQQFSGRIDLGYMSNTVAVTLYGSTIFNTSQESAPNDTTPAPDPVTTFRWDAGAGINFFIIKDWFALLRNDLLHSSEQQLELRSVTKAGFGNYIVNNQRMYFLVAAGAAWNLENYMNAPDSIANPINSAEGFLGFEYRIFDIGDLKFTTSSYNYISMTESPRYRSDFIFDIKYEFAFDLYFGVGFTLNYDSRPAPGSDPTDYILKTTIGWEL